METYKTQSTSANSGKLLDPIVIDETTTTRKVLFADFNDAKKDKGETVGITIVHQRKKGNDEWENVQNIQLSTLKGGEGVKLDLNSETTRKLYDELTKLYTILEKQGVQLGTREYTVAQADEIIQAPKDRKVFIERLLSEHHGEEVWKELIATDPNLATKLSWARVHATRASALAIFKENLEKKNADEGFWQKFFTDNIWVFGYGLNYQFLHLLEDQPNYGGGNYTGKGNQKGDFLMHTAANVKFTVLVEIKTPATELISYDTKRQTRFYRNGVPLLSSQLLGAISQIQVNSRTWTLSSQSRENLSELNSENIFTIEPKGILVIGNCAEIKNNEVVLSCFENFRKNIDNPEIITFDELYERAKYIVDNAPKIEDNNITYPEESDFDIDNLPF